MSYKISKHLKPANLIGKGNERICYTHPTDESKLIKVQYRQDRNQNLIDAIYYAHLKKQGADFTHIANCYEWIDIDTHKGLIFEKVTDYNGQCSQTLSVVVLNHILNKKQTWALITELQQYLIKNRIIFADISEDNILCQEHSPGEYRLVIIDGLGARNLGLKFFLQRKFTPYTNSTIQHQWTKLFLRVNRLLELSEPHSQTLKAAILNHSLDESQLTKPLKNFKKYLQKEKIILPYVSLKHIIIRKTKTGKYEIIAPSKPNQHHLGLRRWALRHFPLYTHNQLRNQWQLLEKKINQALQKRRL